MEEPIYYCENCKKMFKRAKMNISCCVLHPPGDCCHYGDTEIEENSND